ncbi:serine/threonine protein kinase [Deinobacterium chartae]|uniref:Serine/threonine protein kinase n=1 Tax=Deinobacterium chartae TaxID=521158 RepID=A0A841I3V5_9DEIO|nr:class III lanthionine synthetase LanKC [Deinobacterium chartae]MBB6098595.1 serine/threonine protein kinase [Deinobacterium chartae]
MEKPERFYFFMLVSPEHYESFDRYVPGAEYLEVVRGLLPAHWTLQRAKVWFQAAPEQLRLPVQGWKIHVSARLEDARAVLTRTAAICVSRGVAFKFALDARVLNLMNSKGWSRAQGAKFLTLYPTSRTEFAGLLEEMYAALREFRGPYILSDRRYRDAQVLHYRYGGIAGESMLNPQGDRTAVLRAPAGDRVPDVRAPYWHLPEWESEPFAPPPENGEDDALLDCRYRVEGALGFSMSGGVYLATDLDSDHLVVIKEARPHTSQDRHGQDAVAHLRREYRLLQRLADLRVAPRPLAFFNEWEHAFLVEEYLPGMHLGQFTTWKNPILTNDRSAAARQAYAHTLLHLWTRLAEAVAAAHARGVVLGDLSVMNVMVTDAHGEDLRLIDLEGAWQPGEDPPAHLRTPGFCAPEQRRGDSSFESDRYALGAVMLASLFPVTALIELDAGKAESLIRTFAYEMRLPAAAANVLRGLMNPEPALRLPAAQAARDLQACPPDAAPPAAPTLPRLPLERIVSQLLASMDPSRPDRLFPADPGVFFTHPLSVAYGASGVAHALLRINGEVPPELRAWMLQASCHPERCAPGLYCGLSGIGWVMLDLGLEDVGLRLLDEAAAHPLRASLPGVFAGLAGQGLADLYAHICTDRAPLLKRALSAAETLLGRAHDGAQGLHWTDEEGRPNLGYAHGTSGIALFLLYLWRVSGRDDLLEAARRALVYCVSCLQPTRGDALGVPRPDEDPGRQVVTHYWQDGSAGVATALLRYQHATADRRFEAATRALLGDVSRRFTAFPGLFQGLAGLGNTLLDAYQMLGDPGYLTAAQEVADGLSLFALERPHGLAFPGEQLLRVSYDYGTGAAGIALYLDRLEAAARGETVANFNFLLDVLLPETASLPPSGCGAGSLEVS